MLPAHHQHQSLLLIKLPSCICARTHYASLVLCSLGQMAAPSIAQALNAYAHAAALLTAPPPTPHYLPLASSCDSRAQDICYSLLQLQSASTDASQDGAAVDTAGFINSCMQAAAVSPHVAEALLPWRLLCVLQAIGVLQGAADQVCSSSDTAQPSY